VADFIFPVIIMIKEVTFSKERGRNKFAILSVETPVWQGVKV